LPRGVKKNDPRIYYLAKDEKDAVAKVAKCEGSKDKLNFLLRRAAYWDDLLTAKCALEAGAGPNSQNLLGEGPMVSLCHKGSVKMLKLFLSHGASLGPDKFGMPPLLHAIEQFREDLAVEMIASGADVNGRWNATLSTALHQAVTRPKCIGITKHLISAGADPRELNGGGYDVLAYAKIYNEKFGGVPPIVFKILRAALKKWEGKPRPKIPRRKPTSETERMARKYL